MANTVSEGRASEDWIMGSCAAKHMCKDKEAFLDYKKTKATRYVLSAQFSARMKVLGEETVELKVWNGTK